MKINILFKTTDNPAGGGNQFLSSLREYFRLTNAFVDLPEEADVILFNSHHNIYHAAKLKLTFPAKVFVHRIDGPMKIYNSPNDIRDNIVYIANKKLADGTVFQSGWSKKINHELKLPEKKFEAVINNATDAKVFNSSSRIQFSSGRKISLIAASFSPNPNKGFETYKWLDENLDFEKYEMTFIGSSPVGFKNIKHLPPMSGRGLAEKLKASDIFIFASKIEACSNLLMEALSCGLPVVASNSSSNPEIVASGGKLFNQPEQIPALLAEIAGNYSNYMSQIKSPSMDQVGQAYLDFIKKVYEERPYKKFRNIDYLKVVLEILFWNVLGRVGNVI